MGGRGVEGRHSNRQGNGSGGTDKWRAQLLWKSVDLMATGTGTTKTGAGMSLFAVCCTVCCAVPSASRHSVIPHTLYLPPSLQAQRYRPVFLCRVWRIQLMQHGSAQVCCQFGDRPGEGQIRDKDGGVDHHLGAELLSDKGKSTAPYAKRSMATNCWNMSKLSLCVVMFEG